MSEPVSARPLDPAAIRFGADGLVAAIAQDARDGRVLMVAWQDAEAVAATRATGELHFHSRSRGRLWKKGETSGNVLRVAAAAVDCDGDALLWTVEPVGPACHTGARSCFDLAPGAPSPEGFGWLETLWATIVERAATRPAGSYTARLLERGVDGPGRKVAEEAVEVLMAAKDDAVAEASDAPGRDQEALAGEMADLLYHLLVLSAERGLPPSRVLGVLRERHGG
ncbi:MAG: bifunctional phosphoribosyl-AMP cyclohydrolase/phosphoribosyl-ATP diphosphatase HisIE [Chloroflexota bacterium]